MMNTRDRYLNDATFHALVEQLRAMLAGLDITPTELREAVIYAATLHEMETPRPMMLDPEAMESWRRLRAEGKR